MLYFNLPPESLWYQGLSPIIESGKLRPLEEVLAQTTAPIYPPPEQRFSAFALTPLEEVKVVILGQDPYHGAGQGNGLAFSVEPEIPLPPSLRNIFQELQQDCGIPPSRVGDLRPWARQGVLLLNSCLSVEEGKANSHQGLGWEALTDLAISLVDRQSSPTVFLLWGSHAKKKQKLITQPQHLVLTTSHPSPLSVYRGFQGCGHFSQTNRFLEEVGRGAIQWKLP